MITIMIITVKIIVLSTYYVLETDISTFAYINSFNLHNNSIERFAALIPILCVRKLRHRAA